MVTSGIRQSQNTDRLFRRGYMFQSDIYKSWWLTPGGLYSAISERFETVVLRHVSWVVHYTLYNTRVHQRVLCVITAKYTCIQELFLLEHCRCAQVILSSTNTCWVSQHPSYYVMRYLCVQFFQSSRLDQVIIYGISRARVFLIWHS